MTYMIKISTDGICNIMGFPTGSISEQNHVLQQAIGCTTYEIVEPWEDLTAGRRGTAVVLLVDEEGLINGSKENRLVSAICDADAIYDAELFGDALVVGVNGDKLCGFDGQTALNLAGLMSMCRRLISGEY